MLMLGLWDVNDSFYYDRLHVTSQPPVSLRIRSLVGLLPLIAVHIFPQSQLCRLPRFSVQLMKCVDASMQLQVGYPYVTSLSYKYINLIVLKKLLSHSLVSKCSLVCQSSFDTYTA